MKWFRKKRGMGDASDDLSALYSDDGYGPAPDTGASGYSSTDVQTIFGNAGYGDTIQITPGSLSSSDVAALFSNVGYTGNEAGAPPAVIKTSNASDTSILDAFLKNAPAALQAVANYRKINLPGGGAVYQQIDPRTGLPVASSYSVGLAQLSSMVSSNPLLFLGVGLAAVMLLSKPKAN